MAVEPLNVIQVIAKMTQAAQQIRNVYEFIHAGIAAVDDTDVRDDFISFVNTMYGFIVDYITDDLSFDSVEVVNKTQNITLGEGAFPTLTTGNAVSEAGPLQIAYLVRFPSDTRGSQGRKFVPGVVDSALLENGVLDAPVQAALATYGASLVSGNTVQGQEFVYGADNPALARFAAFQSAIVNDVVGTQRRRKQGVGI